MRQAHIDSGKIVGVVHERHPNRVRLYRWWRKIKWPIMADALAVLCLKEVPIPVAIDEQGIVRSFGRPPNAFFHTGEAKLVPEAQRGWRDPHG